MNDLSPPARRYILQLIVLGALLALWELSHLPEKRLELFVVLLSHLVGTYLLKKRKPSNHPKRLASLVIMAAGLLVVGLHLPRLGEQNSWVLFALGAITAGTNILKQPGPTTTSSYQVSLIVYGFTLVVLGAPATMLIVIVAHTLEYSWGTHYPWYIQCFNVATFIISTSAAGEIISVTDTRHLLLGMSDLLGTVLAFVTFVLLNHFFVGLVLKTARNQSFKESGVFGSLTLMIDFCLLSMGAVTAFLWQLNPYAVILGVIPLNLVYRALRMPALERKTETDAKTGVYNAAYFADSIEKELARAHRFDRPLTVAMGDLDYLRDINNRYGHLAGDAVLLGVARTLQGRARKYDVVARFGGEEFAILMPETSPDDAISLIESMRQAIADAEFSTSASASPVKASMSFGLAHRENSGQSVEDIIHNADLALYQAKAMGRNQIVVHVNELEEDVSNLDLAQTPVAS